MDHIGTRLKAERLAANLTQDELAAGLGVTKQAVSSLERGVTKTFRGETLSRACKLFRLNATWLLTGKGPKEAGPSQSVRLDPVTLTNTFNTIVAVLREDGRYFDMGRHAAAFAFVYAEGGVLEPQDFESLRKMLITGGSAVEQEKAGGAGANAGGNGKRAEVRG